MEKKEKQKRNLCSCVGAPGGHFPDLQSHDRDMNVTAPTVTSGDCTKVKKSFVKKKKKKKRKKEKEKLKKKIRETVT